MADGGPRAPRRGGSTSDTDRAVSTTLGYVLALTITTILVSGLLISTGGVIENRERTVTRDELQIVGERVVAGIATADRLADTPSETAPSVAVRVTLPERVAGNGYTVSVDPAAQEVVLDATGVDVTVTTPVPVPGSHLAAASVSGGDLVVVYHAGTDKLEVQSA